MKKHLKVPPDLHQTLKVEAALSAITIEDLTQDLILLGLRIRKGKTA